MFKQWKLNFQIRFAKNKAKTLELPRLVNLLFYEINHRRYRYQVEGITKKEIEEEAMFIPQSIRSVTEISSTSPKNALPKEAMFLENKYIGAVRFLNNNNNYILALAQEDLSESKETHLFFNNNLFITYLFLLTLLFFISIITIIVILLLFALCSFMPNQFSQ